jgi:hypothetical protein
MKSLLLPALMLSTLAVVLLAPAAAQADACIYGACDATACGTTGHRYPTNEPCTGSPSLTCSAPACPACVYGQCSATVCGTSGTQTATNEPCTGASSLSCSAPACPACVYGQCSATACGTSGTQTATNEPCTGASSLSCSAPACPVCDEQSCTAEYSYTGANFNVVSGSRFSSTDSVTASFSIDCGSTGGTGDCRSLAFADHAAAVTSCSFTASGSPNLTITCTDALPDYFFNFETDANGQLAGSYNIALESSLEGGNGARITTSSSGGFTVARPGAVNGEGRVDYAPGVWNGLVPVLPAAVPLLQPFALGALAILLGATFMKSKR